MNRIGPSSLNVSIDDLLAALPALQDHLCVYASGSVVAGWAHAASDLDLYVVTTEPSGIQPTALQHLPVQPNEVPVVVTKVGASRCDLELWTERQVDQVVAKIGRAGSTSLTVLPSEDELDFLARLTKAVPLSGADWLEKRKQSLVERGFVSHLLLRHLNVAESFLDDSVGLLRSRDPWSAALAAREAYGHVVDALLVRDGQLFESRKWRARKFKAATPKDLAWDEYWARESMEGCAADPEAWSRSTIEACRRMMMDIDVAQE